MVEPILETRNLNDICMYVCMYVCMYALLFLTKSTYLEPKKSVIFELNCVLFVIKIAEVLEILLSDHGGYLYPCYSHFWRKYLSQHPGTR